MSERKWAGPELSRDQYVMMTLDDLLAWDHRIRVVDELLERVDWLCFKFQGFSGLCGHLAPQKTPGVRPDAASAARRGDTRRILACGGRNPCPYRRSARGIP